MNEYGLSQGLARNASESEFPGLWRNLVGLWVPSIGMQGDHLADLSGRRNTMGLTGTAWYPGQRGYALRFGAGNQGSSLQGDALSGASAMSLLGWANQDTLDVATGIFQKNLASATNSVLIDPYSDGNFYFEINLGSACYGYFDYSLFVTAGKWFHFACIFDGTQATNATRLKTYINGQQMTLTYDATTIPATLPTNTEVYDMGRVANVYWNGMLDDFRLYSRPLSQAEIVLSMRASPLVRKAATINFKLAAGGGPTAFPWHYYEQMMT